ncbi:uncharacterized protein LOC116293431, partial [Actinia tenebrosa]|uniref:2-amino-4-hydroxy-6-hydroxymethyldihydropteridine diphosphokinase n=1 Tax=Actinia tenebrosa TaxID=6105 RepID=A0A6P8HVU4_ACTTE
MDFVEINSLHARTEVGFSPHEIGKLQELIITIQLQTSRKAGNTDCVKDVINLKTVTKEVLFHVENKKLKIFLTDIEQRLGRLRDASNKNAPRTIDLDISFWNDSLLQYKMLRDSKIQAWSIPDPDTLKHAHVIIPLADV